MRRSRPIRSAVRGALALTMAMVAVGGAWQAVSASTTPAPASTARGLLPGRHQDVVITGADNMVSVTLRRGDTLTVVLSGGGWSTPQSADGKVLHRDTAVGLVAACLPDDLCASTLGTATAAFSAKSDGSSTISSSRSPSCATGHMCPMYVQIFRVNVTVTG